MSDKETLFRVKRAPVNRLGLLMFGFGFGVLATAPHITPVIPLVLISFGFFFWLMTLEAMR